MIFFTKRLNIELDTLSIKDIYNSVENLLSFKFKSKEKDITEENIQSRIRSLLLMAISKQTYGNNKRLLNEHGYEDWQVKYVPHGINKSKFNILDSPVTNNEVGVAGG